MISCNIGCKKHPSGLVCTFADSKVISLFLKRNSYRTTSLCLYTLYCLFSFQDGNETHGWLFHQPKCVRRSSIYSLGPWRISCCCYIPLCLLPNLQQGTNSDTKFHVSIIYYLPYNLLKWYKCCTIFDFYSFIRTSKAKWIYVWAMMFNTAQITNYVLFIILTRKDGTFTFYLLGHAP